MWYWCGEWHEVCMHPIPAGLGSLENLQFSDVREGVLEECLVRVRVRTYATREMRFYGMIPGQRPKGRLRRIVLTLVCTGNDYVRYLPPSSKTLFMGYLCSMPLNGTTPRFGCVRSYRQIVA